MVLLPSMLLVIASLMGVLICTLGCGLIILISKHFGLGLDHADQSLPQKFHTQATPRVAGVAIAFSLSGVVLLLHQLEWSLIGLADLLSLLMLASVPAFVGGIGEDLTGRFRPLIRLLLTFLAAAIAWWLVDAKLTRVGVYLFDDGLAAWSWLSISFTMFAVGGVSHSVNIIDGYNGLMSLVCLLASLVFAWQSWLVDDLLIMQLCFVISAVIVGFLVWNFPYGKIFMGDGGSYLLGFLLAEVAVLLVARHDTISPWSGFLIMSYPITETLFSMYRKKVMRNMSPGLPDGLHLHMIVYKKVYRRQARLNHKSRYWCHGMTSVSLALFACLPMLASMVSFQSTAQCLGVLAVFVMIYLRLYFRLLKK